MKRIIVVLLCAVAGIALANKPNIIVIMADDMGYGDMGANGCEDIMTPQLDRLAETGINFTSGYVTHSFCGPSRAGFFAGRYQQRFAFETNPAIDLYNEHMGLPPSEKTFVKRLQEAGYYTGGLGKWHLGGSHVHYPLKRGFDYYYGFLSGVHDYFKIDLSEPSGTGKDSLIRNTQPASFEGYLTDALTEDAVTFINRNAKTEEPFFLYVGYNAPHAPLQATEEDLAKCMHIEDRKRRTYAAMVYSMDRGIGQILDALEENGIRRNTLVTFFSDNGGPSGNGSNNGPLRSGKGSVHEGGNRVPMIASWPGTLREGKSYHRPVISIDWSRTAVELANAESGPMEGVNLIPYLTGKQSGEPHEALFWRQGGGYKWAIRAGNLKLVGIGDKYELYDLSDDIGEQNNLADVRIESVDSLRRMHQAWNKGNTAPSFPRYSEYKKLREAFHRDSCGGDSD